MTRVSRHELLCENVRCGSASLVEDHQEQEDGVTESVASKKTSNILPAAGNRDVVSLRHPLLAPLIPQGLE